MNQNRKRTQILFNFQLLTVLCNGLLAGVSTNTILEPSGEAFPAMKIIHDSQAAYASLSSYSDTGKSLIETDGRVLTSTFSTRLARPNLYRIEWEQTQTIMRTQIASKEAVWSDGTGDFYLGRVGTEKREKREISFAVAAATTGTIAEVFFGEDNLNSLARLAESPNLIVEKDEVIDGVDCRVVSGQRAQNGITVATTIWIGKTDNLLHRVKDVLGGFAIPIPDSLSATTKKALQEEMEREQVKSRVFSITYNNISVNKPFQKSDFVHEESANR